MLTVVCVHVKTWALSVPCLKVSNSNDFLGRIALDNLNSAIGDACIQISVDSK